MRSSTTISTTFLGLVSLAYIVLGVLGVFALLTKSEGLFTLAALMSLFGLVTPLAIVERYGARAICSLGPGCNFDKFSIYEGQVVIWVLSILAISAGTLTAFGSLGMRRGEKRGYRIWLPIVVVSVAVALWNLSHFLAFSGSLFLPILQLFWALLYALAYASAFRQFRTNKLQ